jgi:hypothetical protein
MNHKARKRKGRKKGEISILEFVGKLVGLVAALTGIAAFLIHVWPVDFTKRIEQRPVQLTDDALVRLVRGDKELLESLGRPEILREDLSEHIRDTVNATISGAGAQDIIAASFLLITNSTGAQLKDFVLRGYTTRMDDQKPFTDTIPTLEAGRRIAICFEVRSRSGASERKTFQSASVKLGDSSKPLTLLDTSTVKYPVMANLADPHVQFGYPPN